MTPVAISEMLSQTDDNDIVGRQIYKFLEGHFKDKNETIDSWVKEVLPEEMSKLIDEKDKSTYDVPSKWLKDHGYHVVISDDGWSAWFLRADEIIATATFEFPDIIKKLCDIRLAEMNQRN